MKKNTLVFIICIVFFFGCKTTERITEKPKLKPLGTEKLIERIIENSYNHQSVEIKKITVQIETSEKKNSFRANLKSTRDEFILLSISKLAVPAIKIMMEPDSIKLINYIDKYWLTDSYDYLENLLNIGIKFDIIQSVIFDNILFSQDFTGFESYIDSGCYVLKSPEKGKAHIAKFLYIDPVNYKIRKVIFENKGQNEHAVINFSGYEYFGDQLYPNSISLDYKGETFLKINLKLSGVEIDKITNITFSIPKNYKQM